MRVITTTLCSGLLISCTRLQGTEPESNELRPDIIMFLVDDMGWKGIQGRQVLSDLYSRRREPKHHGLT